MTLSVAVLVQYMRRGHFQVCFLFIVWEGHSPAAVFIIFSLHGEETISGVKFVHRMGEDIFSCCLCSVHGRRLFLLLSLFSAWKKTLPAAVFVQCMEEDSSSCCLCSVHGRRPSRCRLHCLD